MPCAVCASWELTLRTEQATLSQTQVCLLQNLPKLPVWDILAPCLCNKEQQTAKSVENTAPLKRARNQTFQTEGTLVYPWYGNACGSKEKPEAYPRRMTYSISKSLFGAPGWLPVGLPQSFLLDIVRFWFNFTSAIFPSSYSPVISSGCCKCSIFWCLFVTCYLLFYFCTIHAWT